MRRLCPNGLYELSDADYLLCKRYQTSRPAIDCGNNGIIPAIRRGESFVTLYHIWQCMEAYSRPEQGSVLETGLPNIFYVQEPLSQRSGSKGSKPCVIRATGVVSLILDQTQKDQPGWAITYHKTTHVECPENYWPAGTSLWVSQCAA
jgi:hypothetical protein